MRVKTPRLIVRCFFSKRKYRLLRAPTISTGRRVEELIAKRWKKDRGRICESGIEVTKESSCIEEEAKHTSYRCVSQQACVIKINKIRVRMKTQHREREREACIYKIIILSRRSKTSYRSRINKS